MKEQKKITLGALAKALAYGEFVFFYQPIVSLVTGRVYGAEALIRWQRSDGSIVSSPMFIPLAEETGFITEMTEAMLPRLLDDMASIHQLDPSLSIAFNVSAKDLATDDFTSNTLQAVHEQHIAPGRLGVEITETQAMTLDEQMRNAISVLDAEGMRIAIDDFGCGYSSISLIRDLPVTVLKIDQSFVSRIYESEKCAQIVRHSISLAHQLGIETVGEGVNTQEVFDYLLCFGCDRAQGYYISTPLPLSDFLTFLSRGRRWFTLPPLGLIHLAQQDHMDWRRDFVREILNIVSAEDEEFKRKAYSRIPPLDPHECRLGKWYSGPGQEFRGNALFDQIGDEHEQLHKTANNVARAAWEGAARQEAAESIRSLNTHSCRLICLLGELHTRISLRYKGMIQNW